MVVIPAHGAGAEGHHAHMPDLFFDEVEDRSPFVRMDRRDHRMRNERFGWINRHDRSSLPYPSSASHNNRTRYRNDEFTAAGSIPAQVQHDLRRKIPCEKQRVIRRIGIQYRIADDRHMRPRRKFAELRSVALRDILEIARIYMAVIQERIAFRGRRDGDDATALASER